MGVTTILSENLPEEGVRDIDVSFTDEDGDPVIPNAGTVKWYLYNRPKNPATAPTVINSRSNQSIASASTVHVPLEGDDLSFLAAETGTLADRALVVYYQYDSDRGNNRDDKTQVFFTVERVLGV